MGKDHIISFVEKSQFSQIKKIIEIALSNLSANNLEFNFKSYFKSRNILNKF